MSNELPTIALSLIQPWAFLVAHGYKTIENRPRRIIKNIGVPILIHASARMSREDFRRAQTILATHEELYEAHVALKTHIALNKIDFGGIVGVMTLGREVTIPERNSPWFFGPYGYTVCEARPLDFKRCKGHQGFFNCNYAELA